MDDTVVLPRQAEPRIPSSSVRPLKGPSYSRHGQAAVPVADVPKAFYMGLKTNLLYDALLVEYRCRAHLGKAGQSAATGCTRGEQQ